MPPNSHTPYHQDRHPLPCVGPTLLCAGLSHAPCRRAGGVARAGGQWPVARVKERKLCLYFNTSTRGVCVRIEAGVPQPWAAAARRGTGLQAAGPIFALRLAQQSKPWPRRYLGTACFGRAQGDGNGAVKQAQGRADNGTAGTVLNLPQHGPGHSLPAGYRRPVPAPPRPALGLGFGGAIKPRHAARLMCANSINASCPRHLCACCPPSSRVKDRIMHSRLKVKILWIWLHYAIC